jgi:hypothetical protein
MSNPYDPEQGSDRSPDAEPGETGHPTGFSGQGMHDQDTGPGPARKPGVRLPLGYELSVSNAPDPISAGGPPGGDEERNGPAWEWIGQIGFFKAFFLTMKEVLITPGVTFRRAIREGSLGKPLGFYILLEMLSYFFVNSLFVLLMVPGLDVQMNNMMEMIYQVFPDEQSREQVMEALKIIEEAMADYHPFAVSSIGVYFVSCFFRVFIYALLAHAFLALFGGAQASFEATFRVFAYTMGAVAVLKMIPVCGQAIALLIWFPIILYYGLKEMHETDTWRVVMALIVGPVILIGCCCGGLFSIIMFAQPEILEIFKSLGQLSIP